MQRQQDLPLDWVWGVRREGSVRNPGIYRPLQLEMKKPFTAKGENWGGEVNIILLKKELKIK